MSPSDLSGKAGEKGMDKRIIDIDRQMNEYFGSKLRMEWEVDKNQAIWGACTLAKVNGIYEIALMVASFKGRLVTITPYFQGKDPETRVLKVAYHFDIQGVTITATITFGHEERKVRSITPILKSADWNEREMQEMYNLQVEGHPNSQRLFLDESISVDDTTMIPLSVAMSGAATTTLWEKVIGASEQGGGKHE